MTSGPACSNTGGAAKYRKKFAARGDYWGFISEMLAGGASPESYTRSKT